MSALIYLGNKFQSSILRILSLRTPFYYKFNLNSLPLLLYSILYRPGIVIGTAIKDEGVWFHGESPNLDLIRADMSYTTY